MNTPLFFPCSVKCHWSEAAKPHKRWTFHRINPLEMSLGCSQQRLRTKQHPSEKKRQTFGLGGHQRPQVFCPVLGEFPWRCPYISGSTKFMERAAFFLWLPCMRSHVPHLHWLRGWWRPSPPRGPGNHRRTTVDTRRMAAKSCTIHRALHLPELPAAVAVAGRELDWIK